MRSNNIIFCCAADAGPATYTREPDLENAKCAAPLRDRGHATHAFDDRYGSARCSKLPEIKRYGEQGTGDGVHDVTSRYKPRIRGSLDDRLPRARL